MKRLYFIITIASCLLPLAGMQAQRTLQIEAIPGQFAGQLTEEQMATVEELTLTGELCNSDFAAFKEMPALNILNLQDATVDTIPREAFMGSPLRRMHLPLALDVLEDHAFANSALLAYVYWGGAPSKIGEHVFKGCYSRMEFYVTDETQLLLEEKVLYTADRKKVLTCLPGIFPYIQEGTEEIGANALADANLSHITLPASLLKIGANALVGGHKSINCQAENPPACDGDVFGYNREDYTFPKLNVPEQSEELYRNDPYWGEFFLFHYIAGDVLNVESIPGGLGNQIEELTKDKIGTLRELVLTGDLADEDFYYIRDQLPALTKLDLKGTSVTNIPERAFYGHPSLVEIMLPLGLESISDEAFASTNSYLKIYITGKYPKGKMEPHLGWRVSSDNEHLCQENSGNIFSADKKVLYRAGPIYCYEFQEGLETIESHAFETNMFADYLVFPSTLKEIKSHAFHHVLWTRVSVTKANMQGTSIFIKAPTPPLLGNDAFVFNKDVPCYLVVLPGCADAYRDADPQWTNPAIFDDILEGYSPLEPPQAINMASEESLAIHAEGSSLVINNAETCRLCIYDIAGRCITDCKVENNITIENLPAGMYIYRLQGNDIAESGKFIIE